MKELPAFSPQAEPTPDKRSRATHVMHEVVKRGKHRLIKTLIKDKDGFTELLEQEPNFARDKQRMPQFLQIDERIQALLPEAFIKDPSQWIESQPDLARAVDLNEFPKESSPTIDDIGFFRHEADVHRLKKIELVEADGSPCIIVSKRLNPKAKDLKEVINARAAYDKGIPTPRVLGEILDKGNCYAWFEYIPGKDLLELYEEYGSDGVTIGDRDRLHEKARIVLDLPEEKVFMDELAQKDAPLKVTQESVEALSGQCKRLFEGTISRQLIDQGPYGRGEQEKRRVLDALEEARPKVHAQLVEFIHSQPELEEGIARRTMGTGKHDLSAELIARFAVDEFIYTRFKDWYRSTDRQEPPFEFRLSRLQGELRAERDDLDRALASKIQKKVFGQTLRGMAGKIEQQMAEAGIKPPGSELAYRNFILAWDEEKQKPVLDVEGHSKTYIVDWEE